MTTKTIINADLIALEHFSALYEKHCMIPQSIGEVGRHKIAVRATKPIQKEQPEGVIPDYIMSWIPKNEVPQELLDSGHLVWKAVMWTFPKLMVSRSGGIFGRTMRSINNAPMLFLFHTDYITCAIDGIYPGVFDNKFSATTILRSCKEQLGIIFLAECIAFNIMPNTDKKCTYKRAKKVSYLYPTGMILPYTTAIEMKIDLNSKDWKFSDEGLWERINSF